MSALTLVDLLKRRLKVLGVTYAQLAHRLDLSEASIKRMFSRRDFSLERLEGICRAAGIDFADLARELIAEPARVVHLSLSQEQELVSDPKLLLVALCAVGDWTLEQIMQTYAISHLECVRCLTRLDRQRIIELMPGNRIRPLISRTFRWLPDGPIQRYFRARVEAEYLGSNFDGENELLMFVSGMLSPKSTAELVARMRRLATEFAEMHREDLALPLVRRHGTSVLLAIRPWEPRAFKALRHHSQSPVPAGRLPMPPMVEPARERTPPARERTRPARGRSRRR